MMTAEDVVVWADVESRRRNQGERPAVDADLEVAAVLQGLGGDPVIDSHPRHQGVPAGITMSGLSRVRTPASRSVSQSPPRMFSTKAAIPVRPCRQITDGSPVRGVEGSGIEYLAGGRRPRPEARPPSR